VTQLALVPLAMLLIGAPVAAEDFQEAWAALVNGGHVALVRHGNAPPGYGGDPPGFKIDDCATQRNMDDRGRAQAKAVGAAFRQHGVRADKILSSPWCRCLETATVQGLVGILPGQAETVVLRPRPGKEPGVDVVGRIPVRE
jgi:broad specificity phosphatase PhoE